MKAIIKYKDSVSIHHLVNLLLHEVFHLSFAFFDDKIVQSHPTIAFIDYTQFESSQETKYPGDIEEAKDQGLTLAHYFWQYNELSYQVFYEEKWEYGDWPADSRYSMPEKNVISDHVTHQLNIKNQLNLEITHKKESKTLEINTLINHSQTDIFSFLQHQIQSLNEKNTLF